jgi:hypothetical protein
LLIIGGTTTIGLTIGIIGIGFGISIILWEGFIASEEAPKDNIEIGITTGIAVGVIT